MKDEQRIKDLVRSWCDENPDNRFREVDDLTEEYADLVINNEGLENFGYTDADRDEIYEIVSDVVQEYKDEEFDIFQEAEDWNGNGYEDPLSDDEWETVYENAPDIFIEALYSRAAWVKDWWGEIPDLVWEEIEEGVREQWHSIKTPMAIVDNVLCNSEYGDFDKFKNEGETDEEFIERWRDNCYRIFEEDRFIIITL